MKKVMILLIWIAICASVFAQTDKWGIKFSGFVKGDYFLDTRQTVTAREGHFLLYPAPESLDKDNEDINASPNFNMLAIQTRLTGKITGPDVLGAKSSAVIEGAFFGASNALINQFRLRHAFVKLDWKNSTLLMGQYWHPMFITEVFPGTISFNTGVPFQPFSRNPQIRFVQRVGKLSFTAVAAAQRDFTSTGPNGAVSDYLRNSMIPILNFGVDLKADNIFLGANVNYMSLKPALVYNGYKSDATTSSISLMAYAKLTSGLFGWEVEGVLGQNNFDLLMLGGYAVSNVDTKGIPEFTNLNVMSVWSELYYGKEVQLGLFVGYTQNQGAQDNVTGAVYARGANIESVMRVSPRVSYSVKKLRFACELEYTSAAYGSTDPVTLEVTNTTTASNMRLLLSTYYFF